MRQNTWRAVHQRHKAKGKKKKAFSDAKAKQLLDARVKS